MRVDIFCLLLKNAVIFLRDGNGGMRVAWAWRLHGNFWDFLGIFGRVIGAPCDTPWVCCAAVWYGSGEDVPLRYARLFFMATAVCVLRGRGACV